VIIRTNHIENDRDAASPAALPASSFNRAIRSYRAEKRVRADLHLRQLNFFPDLCLIVIDSYVLLPQRNANEALAPFIAAKYLGYLDQEGIDASYLLAAGSNEVASRRDPALQSPL
jgi:hypothetical protein